jgi:hypothetical protein
LNLGIFTFEHVPNRKVTSPCVAGGHRVAACVPITIMATEIETMLKRRIPLYDEATWTSIGVAPLLLRATLVDICICAIEIVTKNLCRVVAKGIVLRT